MTLDILMILVIYVCLNAMNYVVGNVLFVKNVCSQMQLEHLAY